MVRYKDEFIVEAAFNQDSFKTGDEKRSRVILRSNNERRKKELSLQEIDFNPIQRGVFFANRKRGGGHICPPSVFSEIFSEPPVHF